MSESNEASVVQLPVNHQGGAGYPARLLVSEMLPMEGQPREDFEKVPLEELAQSIKEEGLIHPIVVKVVDKEANPEAAHSYDITSGERRWRAHKMIGEEYISAVFDSSKTYKEQHARALIANIHQENHSFMELSKALTKQKEMGTSVEEMHKKFAFSKPYIYQLMSLQKLTKKLQGMMHHSVPDEKRLKLQVAVALARLDAGPEQEEIFEEVLKLAPRHRLRTANRRVRALLGENIRGRSYTKHAKTESVKPSKGARAIYRLARNMPGDIDEILDLPNTSFISFVQSRPPEDCDSIIADLKKSRDNLQMLIVAIEGARLPSNFK